MMGHLIYQLFRKGLFGRILEQCKKAFYTHCTCHVLNLCIAAICKEHNIQTILSQMTALSIFLKVFSKERKTFRVYC